MGPHADNPLILLDFKSDNPFALITGYSDKPVTRTNAHSDKSFSSTINPRLESSLSHLWEVDPEEGTSAPLGLTLLDGCPDAGSKRRVTPLKSSIGTSSRLSSPTGEAMACVNTSHYRFFERVANLTFPPTKHKINKQTIAGRENSDFGCLASGLFRSGLHSLGSNC